MTIQLLANFKELLKYRDLWYSW